MSLFKRTGLLKQELATGSEFRSAIDRARKVTLDQRVLYLRLLNLDPKVLHAVTPGARIRWGKLICDAFSDHFHLGGEKLEPSQRIYFVTLCDRRCCTPPNAAHIDVRKFLRIFRRGLRGLSYLGMLEPAYYVNVCTGPRRHRKRMVSWHVHVLAWGASRQDMKERITELNQLLLPIADGLAPAHQKCISRGKLADKIAYLLKAPQKGYRLYKWETTNKSKQWKSPLRPGERLTLVRLMRDLYLDQLVLAGGEGQEILDAAKRPTH
jgi:hypothetical protein